MLDYIIGQIRRPFDNAIAAIVGKIAVAVPLLIAAIFLISALNNYLHTLWGPVGANLAMAGLFFAIAALAALIFANRRDRREAQDDGEEKSMPAPVVKSQQPGMVQSVVDRIASSPQEKELALSIATTALPFVLPRLLKLSLRHWQIVGAAAAGYYLIVRKGGPRRTLPRRVIIAGTGRADRPVQTRRIK